LPPCGGRSHHSGATAYRECRLDTSVSWRAHSARVGLSGSSTTWSVRCARPVTGRPSFVSLAANSGNHGSTNWTPLSYGSDTMLAAHVVSLRYSRQSVFLN